MSVHPKRRRKKRLKKYFIDEIATVDFGSQETAKATLMKRRGEVEAPTGRRLTLSTDEITILKDDEGRTAILLTSEVDGHTHAVYLWGGALGGETSFGIDPDSDSSHDHPWVFDGSGGITVGANDGHTHEVDGGLVFQAVMAIQKGMTKAKLGRITKSGIAIDAESFPIEDEAELASAIQSFGGAIDTEESADYIRESAQSIDAEDLVPESGPLAFADDLTADRIGEETEMPKTSDEKTQASIVKLEAKLARADSIVALDDGHRPYFKGLNAKAQDEFLTLGASAQSEAVSAHNKSLSDADPVVFKSADDTEYRKSDDPRIVKMARERDEDRVLLRKAQADADTSTFLKRATDELPNSPGKPEVGAALLKALNTISEEDGLRDRAYLVVKAGDNALSGAYESRGTHTVDPASDPAHVRSQGDATVEMEALVTATMEKDSIDEATAFVKVLETKRGADLYTRATN